MSARALTPRASIRVSFALLAAGLLMGVLTMAGAFRGAEGEGVLTGSIFPGGWMAWIWATVIFFGLILLFLTGMTLWGALRPEPPRMGILRIETTPGDRLFISLLGSAFINLAWLGALGAPLWGALALALIYAAGVFRWV